jgi:hypothetical protein
VIFHDPWRTRPSLKLFNSSLKPELIFIGNSCCHSFDDELPGGFKYPGLSLCLPEFDVEVPAWSRGTSLAMGLERLLLLSAMRCGAVRCGAVRSRQVIPAGRPVHMKIATIQ